MAQYPSLPVFTDAILADCGHLDDAELGRYFKILMFMWRHPECRLPNDPAWLARKFQRTPDAFEAEILPLLKEFCASSGNWWTQKRLTKEFNYVGKARKKARDAANTRWNKEKDVCASNAPHPTPPTPTNNKPQTPLLPELVDKPDGFLKNGGVDKKVYRDISLYLNDKAMQAARAAVPGWDIYNLISKYNEGMEARGMPQNPAGAFIAWCKNYTKGKPHP